MCFCCYNFLTVLLVKLQIKRVCLHKLLHDVLVSSQRAKFCLFCFPDVPVREDEGGRGQVNKARYSADIEHMMRQSKVRTQGYTTLLNVQNTTDSKTNPFTMLIL